MIMENMKLEDLSIKDLKARLETITKERAEIVAVIQSAADAIGLEPVKSATPAAPKARKVRTVKAQATAGPKTGTTADKVEAALAGGKVMEGADLVKALVAAGANKGTATQFLYSKLGKKMLKKTDDGWQLKG